MKSIRARVLGLLIALVFSQGCFAPSAGLYRPASEEEYALFARARRDITPDSIRSGSESPAPDLVVWAGILQSLEPGSDPSSEVTVRVEHHYWDWVIDYGTQSTKILLSPGGEGVFEFQLTGAGAEWLRDHAQIGDFTIVYGVPQDVRPDGVIQLRYVHSLGMPKSRYSLDVWDYDGDFALRGRGSPRQVRLQAF